METSSSQTGGVWQVIKVLIPERWLGGGEDQPDERPDGRVFPVTRQAELRTPGTIDCAREGRVVISSPAPLKSSRRAAPLGTEDGPPLHGPAAGRAVHHGIGRWIISWMVGGLGVCVCTFRDR